MIAAKIGFTKVLDRKCAIHGGHYSSHEKSVCPKCSNGLIELTRVTAAGETVKYCITEVTLYPLHRQSMADDLVKRTTATNGLLYTYRLSLFGRYDKATDTVTPDNRTRYLVPKRVILVECNDFPVLKPYFSVQANAQKIEIKYVFNKRLGDDIRFIDDKQEAQQYIKAAEAEKARPSAVTDAAGIPDPATTGAAGTLLDFTNMGVDELAQVHTAMASRLSEIRTTKEVSEEVHHKSEVEEGAAATGTAPDPFPGASVDG